MCEREKERGYVCVVCAWEREGGEVETVWVCERERLRERRERDRGKRETARAYARTRERVCKREQMSEATDLELALPILCVGVR